MPEIYTTYGPLFAQEARPAAWVAQAWLRAMGFGDHRFSPLLPVVLVTPLRTEVRDRTRLLAHIPPAMVPAPLTFLAT